MFFLFASLTHAQALELDSGAANAGLRVYTERTWGVVSAAVENHGPTAETPDVSVQLGEGGRAEFVVPAWLPPQTRRQVTVPVYPLEGAAGGDGQGLATTAWVRYRVDGRQISVPPAGEPGLLLYRDLRLATGVLADADDDAARAASKALRAKAGLSPTSFSLNQNNAPQLPAVWDGLDTLVVSQRDPSFSPAQLEGLRQWVMSGGRLWILLDEVGSAFPARLLGDAWQVTPIDRVQLSEFTIEGSEEPMRLRPDYPAEMARVIAPPGADVTHEVDGFPAAFTLRVGQGRVLVTTLSARAWITEDEEATVALGDLEWFSQPAAGGEEPGRLAAFDDFAVQQIGYQIMGRGPVLLVLGVFAAGILVIGLVLAKRGRLEWVGVAGAAMAVLAAGVLWSYGVSQRGDKPLTIASTQLITPAGELPYANLESLVSIYTPRGVDLSQIEGKGAGTGWPRGSGSSVRVRWDDLDSWRFMDMNLPNDAVQLFELENTRRLDRPLRAVAEFDERGVSGRLEGLPFESLDDAVLATPTGHLPAALEGEGRFSAAVEGGFADAQQFIRAVTLGQEQIARQSVYRRLLGEGGYPDRPALLAWCEGMDSGVEVAGDAQRQSSALLVAPVEIRRPQPGARVTIPAAFLPMSPARMEDMPGYRSTLYNEATGEWVTPINGPAKVLMAFEVPDALRPLEVEEARLRLHIRAPGWGYRALVYRDGTLAEGPAGQNPLDTIDLSLTGNQAPIMTDDGRLVVGVDVHIPEGAAAGQAWDLTGMELSVTGTVGQTVN